MTADAAAHQRPSGHLGAHVVWTTATEIRRAIQRERNEHPRASSGTQGSESIVGESFDETRPQRAHDRVGIKRTVRRQEVTTLFVVLARDRRSIGGRPERLFEHGFERGGLILDHENLGESGAEATQQRMVDRRDQPKVKQANAGIGNLLIGGQPQHAQRLTDLGVGVPSGSNTDPGVVGIDIDGVEIVLGAIGTRQLETNLVQLAFEVERVRRE